MPVKKRNRPTRKYDSPSNFYEAVYKVVCRIPEGRVMSYGQIATILGSPRAARAVGYALGACPEELPWQRVINAKGQISARGEVERPEMQRLLLEGEGVTFDAEETCDLKSLRWEPRNPEQFFFEGSASAPFG